MGDVTTFLFGAQIGFVLVCSEWRLHGCRR